QFSDESRGLGRRKLPLQPFATSERVLDVAAQLVQFARSSGSSACYALLRQYVSVATAESVLKLIEIDPKAVVNDLERPSLADSAGDYDLAPALIEVANAEIPQCPLADAIVEKQPQRNAVV